MDEQLKFAANHILRAFTPTGTFPTISNGLVLIHEDVAPKNSKIYISDGLFLPYYSQNLKKNIYNITDHGTAHFELTLSNLQIKQESLSIKIMIDTSSSPLLNFLSNKINLTIRITDVKSNHSFVFEKSDLFKPQPLKTLLKTSVHIKLVFPIPKFGKDEKYKSFKFQFKTFSKKSLTNFSLLYSLVKINRLHRQYPLKSVFKQVAIPYSLNNALRSLLQNLLKNYKFTNGLLNLYREKVKKRQISSFNTSKEKKYFKMIASWNNISDKSFNIFHGTKFINYEKLYKQLFTNACGDFTLMAHEHWFKLRGYAEFQAYSMNIDSILLFATYYSGIRIEILPFLNYHIDHGNSVNPESIQSLQEKMKHKFIDWVDWPVINAWLYWMEKNNKVLYFAPSNWGFADKELKGDKFLTMQLICSTPYYRSKNRYLILSLTINKFKLRYRTSVLSFAWVFLEPLIMLLIYLIAFVWVLKVKWGIANENPVYQALLIYIGVILFQFFSSTLNEASQLIQGNIIIIDLHRSHCISVFL